MPVQRFDARPVDRPSGLIPPPVRVDGVTLLRIPGADHRAVVARLAVTG